MRHWNIACLVYTLLLILPGTHASAAEAPTPPPLSASAYLLIDAQTGQILAAHNEHLQLSIASTTKIMTAILALESGRLSDEVTVSPRAASIRGTSMYLTRGERQPLVDLLHGMMLVSANDAAAAIAEHLGGTEATFVQWMNAKAQELGATQTRYANAYGFDNTDHYSTATDLAIIARYAMANPTFRQLVATPARTIGPFEAVAERYLTNRNPLLTSMDGALGIKNGYTRRARYTYVAAARRDNTELIAVVLGTEDNLWTPARQLLEYGFRSFERHVVLRGGQVAGEAEVTGGQPVAAHLAADLVVMTPRGDGPPEVRMVWAPQGLQAPVVQGQPIGQVQARTGEVTLSAVPLLATEARLAPEPPAPMPPEPSPNPVSASSPWLVLGLVGAASLVLVATRFRTPHRR